jgi:2-amino-4-hydroxy-6-hydroxymethyldihydropteridine diphosphokinase
MLAHLHHIEHLIGRTRSKRWEPRIIDLDLIDFDGEIAPNPARYRHWRELPLEKQMKQVPEQLILPHPRLQDRPFVLVPMRDIMPDWVHPVTGETLDRLLEGFTKEQLAEIHQMPGTPS